MTISDGAIRFLLVVPVLMGVTLVIHLSATFQADKEKPDFSEIDSWLLGLLRNGFDGENILFRHERTGRFVRFEKHGDAGGGIALTFPAIRWGRDYLPRLQAYCDDHGLSFQPSSDEGVRTAGCAQIDFGDDLKAASALSRIIWTGFFGYGLSEPHTRSTGDFSTIAELTCQPPVSVNAAEGQRRLDSYWTAHLKRTGVEWLGLTGFKIVFGLAGLGLLVAPFGLPISTLMSVGDPPGWHTALGPIQAQGSIASLAFFVLYIFSFVGVRRLQRRRPINPRLLPRISRMVLAFMRPMLFAMPVAVVLVWLGI